MIDFAVILCGGFGTRLGSLTKNKQKGMLKVEKKPFLEHLIVQLKKNKIKKILLLTGFKSKQIENYFGDGKKFGVKIIYSFSSPETNTLKRIFNARNLIKKDFLLLYSDNYYPLNLDKLFNFYKNKKKPICLNLCKKKVGNFQIKKNKIIYSLKKSQKYNYVEVGYSIIKQNIIKQIPNKNINLNYFFKEMIKKNKISCFKNYHNYLSIGDQKRLKITRQYFKKKNLVLIDRDGTLNKKIHNKRYITNVNEIELNMSIINILKKFKNLKFLCITNQAGVSTKDLTKFELIKINSKLKDMLRKNGIKILKYFISTDHYLSNSFNRKPNPGLFLEASKKYKFLLDQTIYIGDDKRDISASYNASTKCFFLGKKNNKLKNSNFVLKGSLSENLKLLNDKK